MDCHGLCHHSHHAAKAWEAASRSSFRLVLQFLWRQGAPPLRSISHHCRFFLCSSSLISSLARYAWRTGASASEQSPSRRPKVLRCCHCKIGCRIYAVTLGTALTEILVRRWSSQSPLDLTHSSLCPCLLVATCPASSVVAFDGQPESLFERKRVFEAVIRSA